MLVVDTLIPVLPPDAPPSGDRARGGSEFFDWLAVIRHMAAVTQNQPFNALVNLYGKVLDRPLGNRGDTRAKPPARMPTALPLLEHADVRTTQIYTHVLGTAFAGVQSPLG